MPIIELTSKNASFRYGGVLLTQKSPRAHVSEDVALKLLETGRVVITKDSSVEGKTQQDTPDNTTHTEQSNNGGESETERSSLLDELNQATKVDEVEAIAAKYGVDLSGCKNMEQRKAAILEAFEEV